jgi:hypothetical protein
MASGTDDVAGAQVPGDLHGHPPGAAGGRQDQDLLTRPEGDAPAQGDPSGHGGVHGRDDEDGSLPPGRTMLHRRSTTVRATLLTRMLG